MSTAQLDAIKPKSKLPHLTPGDTVRINLKVHEGDKERIQSFQGVVIRLRSGGAGGSFTVRRVAYGVGIERTFPMASPLIERIQVIRHGKVRRAKLYYLRGLSAKKARIKERRLPRGFAELVTTPEAEPAPEPAPEAKK
ncbi:MAG: 50S ribosomal protein L19 [Dehalococcoidia bacterium]|nr:50S ribosomal protein L19 [Dehalococcoidia bacterium]